MCAAPQTQPLGKLFVDWSVRDLHYMLVDDFAERLADLRGPPEPTERGAPKRRGHPGPQTLMERSRNEHFRHDSALCWRRWQRAALITLVIQADLTGFGHSECSKFFPPCLTGPAVPSVQDTHPMVCMSQPMAFVVGDLLGGDTPEAIEAMVDSLHLAPHHRLMPPPRVHARPP